MPIEVLATILKGAFIVSTVKTIANTVEAMFRCNSVRCRGQHLVKAVAHMALHEGAESVVDVVCDGCGEVGQAKLKVAGSTGTQSSGCFIATAIYGYSFAPEVLLLRKFRDEILIGHPVGRKIVHLYYQISPRWAKIVERSSTARKLGKLMLFPIVWLLRRARSLP